MTDKQPKGWIATLIVALLMVGIVGSGFVAEGAVADEPTHPVGLRGTAILPADGWDFAGRSDDQSTFLLTNGTGSLAVEVQPRGPSLLMPCGARSCLPIDDKRKEWLDTGTVTASEPEQTTVGGHRGWRFTYSGTFDDISTPVEGTVTYIEGGAHYSLFDAWAGEGQYSLVSEEVDSMIGTSVLD